VRGVVFARRLSMGLKGGGRKLQQSCVVHRAEEGNADNQGQP
jgi:hypothetical protein